MGTSGMGGWLRHSYFAVYEGELGGSDFRFSYSMGDATGNRPLTGGAKWSGVMVGTDSSKGVSRPSLVRGDADITIPDLDNPRIDIAFTRIRKAGGGGLRDDMEWENLRLTSSGRFRDSSGGDSIQGTFYGPGHEEVGGIFERDSITGAFGAKRE